jgi:hypothetical protein
LVRVGTLFFFLFFGKKLNSNQNVPQRQLFLFSSAKLTSATAFYFFCVRKTYLSDRILSKKSFACGGRQPQLFHVIKLKIKERKKNNIGWELGG